MRLFCPYQYHFDQTDFPSAQSCSIQSLFDTLHKHSSQLRSIQSLFVTSHTSKDKRSLAFLTIDSGTSKYSLVFKILQLLNERVRSLKLSDFVDIDNFSLITSANISRSLAIWQQLSLLLGGGVSKISSVDTFKAEATNSELLFKTSFSFDHDLILI